MATRRRTSLNRYSPSNLEAAAAAVYDSTDLVFTPIFVRGISVSAVNAPTGSGDLQVADPILRAQRHPFLGRHYVTQGDLEIAPPSGAFCSGV